ncbi:protein kinase [Achlya hypogyna]|uniref:Protein kinase n=1 Tax=Achlya hypogyna TaxID=1202772 RepID=A0A1V9YPY0_ACHHY|nr:protein kinase [Achlya hypogyna]
MLLRANADVHRPLTNGATPMHMAAFGGSICAALHLLRAKANINQRKNDGWTPLHVAASHGHSELVERLLEHGADWTIQNNVGQTAFDVAVNKHRHMAASSMENANTSEVLALLQKAPETQLRFAVLRDEAKMIQRLLTLESSVPTAEVPLSMRLFGWVIFRASFSFSSIRAALYWKHDGKAPLNTAVETGNIAIVAALLTAGADPNIVDTTTGRAVLATAAMRDDAFLVNLMASDGADVNAQDHDGCTALMLAAHRGHADVVRTLLRGGADTTLQSKAGYTVLSMVIKQGDRAMADLIHSTTAVAPVHVDMPAFELSHSNSLGRGAYGSVLKSEWRGIPVAVKTPYGDGDSVNAFRSEMASMTTCSSPYILPLLAIVNGSSALPQAILPFMNGGNLAQHLRCKRERRPTVVDCSTLEVAWVLANALVDLHEKNILHRDVKSDNVFLSSQHYIKLGDLGIATEFDEEHTMTLGAGTLFWVAPEALSGRYGMSADIYSFGVVLTELDTLDKPYKNDTRSLFAIVDAVRSNQLRPSLSATCEYWYKDLAMRCMDHDPSVRPTAVEVVEILLPHIQAAAQVRPA